MRRVRVSFAGLSVEFVDRERALEQVRELGVKGTYPVYVIYGPEGCGKSALLKQAKAILEEEFGYHVVYVNPLAEKAEDILQFTPSVKDIVKEVLSLFPEPYSRIVDVAVSVASRIIKALPRPRVAVLMDDIFQAVGLDKAEAYVKTLLNLIEYPSREYERIAVLVASSEGVTRRRIGRHRWADIFVMWNMGRDGFEQLYGKLPDPKPPFEEAWRLTGGNPGYLGELYRHGWSVDAVVDGIARRRGVKQLAAKWGEALARVVEDPDYLWEGYPETEALINDLVEANLIAEVWDRKPYLWFDAPPPEKVHELGIGREYAWQTPLHREAARRALQTLGASR